MYKKLSFYQIGMSKLFYKIQTKVTVKHCILLNQSHFNLDYTLLWTVFFLLQSNRGRLEFSQITLKSSLITLELILLQKNTHNRNFRNVEHWKVEKILSNSLTQYFSMFFSFLFFTYWRHVFYYFFNLIDVDFFPLNTFFFFSSIFLLVSGECLHALPLHYPASGPHILDSIRYWWYKS